MAASQLLLLQRLPGRHETAFGVGQRARFPIVSFPRVKKTQRKTTLKKIN